MKTVISKKYIHRWIFVILIIGGLLTACQDTIVDSAKATSTFNTQLSTSNSHTYITAGSVSELTQKSSIVIIGTVTKIDDIINMARDGNDLTKPDPNLFEIGQIYELNVSEYLKNDQGVSDARIIKVIQPQGIIVLQSKQPPIVDEIEKARSSEKYVPLKVGNEYLLFLVPLVGFPETDLYFTGVAYPWQFILADNCAYPESPWQVANTYFQPQLITNYIDQVSNSINNKVSPTEPIAYPPPFNNQTKLNCPPLNSMTTPYP